MHTGISVSMEIENKATLCNIKHIILHHNAKEKLLQHLCQPQDHMADCDFVCVFKFLTPVADHTYRWRREDEETLPQQCKLPKHHYLLPKKPNELGHAASWVGDLRGSKL